MRPAFVRKVPAAASAAAGTRPWATGCRVCQATWFFSTWAKAMMISELHSSACSWPLEPAEVPC